MVPLPFQYIMHYESNYRKTVHVVHLLRFSLVLAISVAIFYVLRTTSNEELEAVYYYAIYSPCLKALGNKVYLSGLLCVVSFYLEKIWRI